MCQNFYRKTVEVSCKIRYETDIVFHQKVKCFAALEFLPSAHVQSILHELCHDDDAQSDFLNYNEVSFF